mmetsp:Transcript_45454/g.114433  ORF Transcript_45454/g.114433 Transcript_45454/m.114433 type:complete len:214 (+) Transcript_45454:108-749(+)
MQRLRMRSSFHRSPALALLITALAALTASQLRQTFVMPPPVEVRPMDGEVAIEQPPREVPRAITADVASDSVGMGAAEWLQHSAAAELGLMALKLRSSAGDAAQASQQLLDLLQDGALTPGMKPVPVAGALSEPQPRNLLEEVLQPVTKFFMKYKWSIKPRCKECRIVHRYGRIWRLCDAAPRHKARQPGHQGWKRTITRHKGWSNLGAKTRR